MTNDDNTTFDISRRKLLGGLGAIGVASAGAGLGTTAYFSDQESFENNTITAGTLSMFGSWQQLYYGADQSVRPGDYGDAERPWVNAFPDHDGDGIQSLDEQRQYVDDPSDDPAMGRNLPLSCSDFTALDGGDRPVIALDDVKPGDKGEVTFGFTVCDNPAYVWMNGEITDDTPGQGEGDLADYLMAKVWRDDDCDNVYDDLEPSDIVLVIDYSGSMFYNQYGELTIQEPITIDDGYGETSYAETTKIDLVEQGVVRFIDLLQDAIDDDPDIASDAVRLGAVFFDGYSNDDDPDNPGPNVLTSMDVSGWGDPDNDGFTSDITDLITLDDGDAPLRNLRAKLADLVDGPSGSFDNADNISVGTALEEGFEALVDLFTNRVDDSRRAQSVTFTDGEPYFGGSLGSDRYEDLLIAANLVRTDDNYASNIFIVGDQTAEGEAQFTKRVMAGPAGLPIEVSDAVDDGFPTGDEANYGGDPAFYFDIEDPASIPELFAQVAIQILPEQVISYGTLREVLTGLGSGPGTVLNGSPLDDSAECFETDVTHCLGFSWEFPIRSTDDEAELDNNDVQGAELVFDLGLYAEQCRHNDPETNAI